MVINELAQRSSVDREREHRDAAVEPQVRGPEDHRAELIGAGLTGEPEGRMATPTQRHDRLRRRAEGFGEGLLGATVEAGHEQVGGAATRADVVDAQDRVRARGDAIVGKPHPREVVEVSSWAAGDEPGWDCGRWLVSA